MAGKVPSRIDLRRFEKVTKRVLKTGKSRTASVNGRIIKFWIDDFGIFHTRTL